MSGGEAKEALLKELLGQAAKWVEKEVPSRMEAVGASEQEVRRQFEAEADHWVQYNVDQRSQGKDGSPSPDFHIKEGQQPASGLQRGGRPVGPDPE